MSHKVTRMIATPGSLNREFPGLTDLSKLLTSEHIQLLPISDLLSGKQSRPEKRKNDTKR